ncbi:D-alanyl-D-alanine carboxypeptidase/D-alanyl-D-alanine-endopeptidase (penicillin-binding protein 4) [Saccharopolyspora lacisalsi]|uniref:D-alanyl-D-alanine carboxypeptidase/D-alanyl-D-alanine-endopeptidase (Penicillin-binding protein 4) n=1 Tax=Halosaccharopolyspora lacisalsi TaxID=1000566 RepID=A0A839E6P8_9PSEU|nr:D-alanyl-D-alanine carboxypeptidase/D-alanyl-D-alanine-endopeptidase [Halosaccharopolyspora lacisalsi]MBA8826558.1 D-alanyl-D-alanine carboxypeptidase/D-alanyl-D-alanine-endopeptidase (penicillin-binding protein 4) [Halosaccharopolyspora lacisalsi]
MSQPHKPRGEDSESGVDEPASEPTRLPAEAGEQGSEASEQPEWPAGSPSPVDDADEADAESSESTAQEWPTEEEAAGASEATAQSADVERTQQISRVELDEGLNQETVRTDTREVRDEPEPDNGPPTVRIPPVPPAPVEQPTEQFARPDFAAQPSPRRSAQPSDFFGLTGSQPVVPAAEPARPDPAPAPAPPAETQAPERDEQPQAPERDEQPGAPRRRRGLIAVALVAVVALGVGAAFGIPALFGGGPRAAAPAPVQLDPRIEPVTGTAPTPDQQQLSEALAPVVSNPALGEFGGVVMDPASGRTLWKQNAGRPLVPASTGKLLTAGAAMIALDHRHRFTTKVVRGDEPGSVVLVGGGDPTLSALSGDEQSVYPAAPKLGKLVQEVREATGGEVTSVTVDTSRYTGRQLAPGWVPADVTGGYIAPMQPVMLDGGRVDPTKAVSPRSKTPALDAGRELAKRLGAPEAGVKTGTAPEDARVLGEVKSATVRKMTRTLLQHSDNVLAEALGRQVAIATGHQPSFSGTAEAVHEVLTEHGFDLSGTRMVDANGLSPKDRVTPRALGSVLAATTVPRGRDGTLPKRTRELRDLLLGLPVAGSSGSLAGRYEQAAASGRGWVRAKTGTLTDVNGLAGTVVTSQGKLLVFALISNGTSSAVARPALDRVAATLSGVGSP